MVKIENNNYINRGIKIASQGKGLVRTLPKKEKICYGFIKQRENLSTSRFFQDVTTNWLPKAVFSRSIADFSEMSFLEYTESALFYFAPMLLSNVLAKSFSKLVPKGMRPDVKSYLAKPTETLLKESDKNPILKRAIPLKAAMVLGCVAIPAGEYALSFAKNLLTLKVFKKSNFDNIANLNKGSKQQEDKLQQERVRGSAVKHIKRSAVVSSVSIGAGIGLALFGHKSNALQKISKAILRPGMVVSRGLAKLGIKSDKIDKNLNTYINFDCDIKNNKPVLSKGQLVVSTVLGLFGYSSAGKDRGKLDQLEVLTRVPIVVLYTIFGSEAFDWVYKHILLKKHKYPDLIKREQNSKKIVSIPERKDLENLARNIAKKKNTPVEKEFKRLVKEKAAISAIPYGFSLLFMGFLLAGISRFWTQYRFNHNIGKIKSKKQNKQTKYFSHTDKFPWRALASHVVNV